MRLVSLKPARRRRTVVLGLLSLLVFAGGAVMAYAKGGTAKPPTGAILPASLITPTLPDPAFAVGDPRADPKAFHGFDDTGFIQDATVSGADCSTLDRRYWGGTVKINNVTYTVPCNMVIQMPANTLTWSEFVDGNGNANPLAVTLAAKAFPSFEMRVVGNDINDRRIAGLMFASQQSANTGTGVISKIDYATGEIHVKTTDPANPVVLKINDPNGRFGRKSSPDDRFSVDDENPTIHAGTGYPMCVPRTDPTVAGGDDPLCPQANRPARMATTVNGATVPAVSQCANFSTSGLLPPTGSGEISGTPAGQYCSQFVMPKAAVYPCPDPGTTAGTTADPCQQAPFEVGDQISWSGTLLDNGAGGQTISAHTIEANVGIYTYTGSQPSYLAIGEFGVGSADPSATSVTGVAQETQDRIFLEAETTDVKTPVDIYMQDVRADGSIKNRWITPFEMTGENQTGTPSGGITTQNTGAQPQRARLRATKSPTGLLSQPTRTIKVAVRSLCTPKADPSGNLDQAALDTCFTNAPKAANGLVPGQYVAPTFEFIFPENVKPGDALVPNDLWHLPFLVKGEPAAAGSSDPNIGPLTPAPW